MRKLERLIREARESCNFRGHKMAQFRRSKSGVYAAAYCTKCDRSVVVLTNPLPNEIDIGGEAVALGCCDAQKGESHE